VVEAGFDWAKWIFVGHYAKLSFEKKREERYYFKILTYRKSIISKYSDIGETPIDRYSSPDRLTAGCFH
jgi:hypothetical protein